MSEPTDCRRPECTDEPHSAAPTLSCATVASERAYGLAEGPLWDEQRERVLWVDINAGRIHSDSVDGYTITPGGQPSANSALIQAPASTINLCRR